MSARWPQFFILHFDLCYYSYLHATPEWPPYWLRGPHVNGIPTYIYIHTMRQYTYNIYLYVYTDWSITICRHYTHIHTDIYDVNNIILQLSRLDVRNTLLYLLFFPTRWQHPRGLKNIIIIIIIKLPLWNLYNVSLCIEVLSSSLTAVGIYIIQYEYNILTWRLVEGCFACWKLIQ